MDNLVLLMCIAGAFLIALSIFLSLSSLMGRGPRTYSPFGTRRETPRYDEPTISSGGSFGGAPRQGGAINLGGNTPRHNDPNIRSGGSFGGP